MTANASLNEYINLELKNSEDLNTITNTISSIKKEFFNYYPSNPQNNHEKEEKADYAKIVNSVLLSVRASADSSYKPFSYLATIEIDQIKNSLNNYITRNENVKAFKKEIIDDLTEFQNQIKTTHAQKLNELEKERQFYEKQLRVIEFKKNKLIMDRLFKIVWPYDKKTKDYDNKITRLERQMQTCLQKMAQLKCLQPSANEKDILLYQLHLKEKYLT
jgi:hypothetical protein